MLTWQRRTNPARRTRGHLRHLQVQFSAITRLCLSKPKPPRFLDFRFLRQPSIFSSQGNRKEPQYISILMRRVRAILCWSETQQRRRSQADSFVCYVATPKDVFKTENTKKNAVRLESMRWYNELHALLAFERNNTCVMRKRIRQNNNWIMGNWFTAKRLGPNSIDPTWLPRDTFCKRFLFGCLFSNGWINLNVIMGGKDKQRTKGNVKVW